MKKSVRTEALGLTAAVLALGAILYAAHTQADHYLPEGVPPTVEQFDSASMLAGSKSTMASVAVQCHQTGHARARVWDETDHKTYNFEFKCSDVVVKVEPPAEPQPSLSYPKLED